MELELSNSDLKAIVDDKDYDLVKDQKWFYDQGHAYANIDMPTDNPDDEPERIKVRLDRYILGLTAHNFVKIVPGSDTLDYRRSFLHQYPLNMVANTEGMTRYLGVTSTKGKIIVSYKEMKDKKKEYDIRDDAHPAERKVVEEKAARQYDEWARYHEGPNAVTNFLPKSIYPK